MSKEFQEKLELYKQGKLNQAEMKKIDDEIDKFNAIWDFLNTDEKEFFEELKQQMPPQDMKEENKITKLLKRKLNLRIIFLTACSVFLVLAAFSIIYFTASRITTSLFALDQKEINANREAMVQLAQMFQPQYKSHESNISSSLFAQQNIKIALENTVGNTKIDRTELSVKYSFGKPVRSDKSLEMPFIFNISPYLESHEANRITGFEALENAPQGTKAKIFIEFNKALTAQDIKEKFINNIDNKYTASLDFTPVAIIGSEFVLANPSYYQLKTVFQNDNNNAALQQNNSFNQTHYENMDNDAHKESLVDNLNLIKNNLRLLQIIYYDNMFENINFDDLIKQVENNGAEYVGMYISGDSKELLKLKNNPLVHCVEVENIVIW